jgi:DNA (cytosine-5)-methyltransferase 1
MTKDVRIKFLDLFSGIGGFSLGFIGAGVKFSYHAYSEIDPYASNIYKRRFPYAEGLGNIKSIQPDNLPEIDIITFGSPCQDISISGRRGGLRANRSSLFFEALRIIEAKRPKNFIFENVKGLFSSNEGQDFDIVLRSIADIGYDGQWQLLNTRLVCGLPQHRERIYFVGHIRGKPIPQVFPISGDVPKTNIILKQIGTIGDDSEATRVYDPRGVSRTIKYGGGMGAKTGLYMIDNKIRRLTPTEVEKVQGFPVGHTDGYSDAQRYKCLGNAVSVPVVEKIARRLIKGE